MKYLTLNAGDHVRARYRSGRRQVMRSVAADAWGLLSTHRNDNTAADGRDGELPAAASGKLVGKEQF